VPRFVGGAARNSGLLFYCGHIENVAQSSNWRWLRTRRFIAKQIAPRKRRAGN
jgi:hypothetical protein